MKDENLLRQMQEVNDLRAAIDATGPTFPESQVKADVMRVYGRSFGRTTWSRWKFKCGITADLLAQYNGEYPSGAYLLLMVNARLSRGNGPNERSRKVTRLQLVAAVRAHRRKAIATSTQSLPEQLSAQELEGYAEAQANRQYHPKTHQKRGIHRSRCFYTKREALEILNQYPTFAIGA